MIVGIGIDIVEIERFVKMAKRHEERLLKLGAHAADLRFAPKAKAKKNEYWAARFAVKEAVSKALGTGFGSKFNPRDVGVEKDRAGKPNLVFAPALKKLLRARGVTSANLSITHTNRYAAAFVVLEGKNR